MSKKSGSSLPWVIGGVAIALGLLIAFGAFDGTSLVK